MSKRLKVLIACEHSGVVREAFRKLGHDAWSCDLLPADDNSPYHIRRPVETILDGAFFDLPTGGRYVIKWDLMIAHPPCTDLAVSGARYFERKRADGSQIRAIRFFMMLARADIPRICIENPVSIMSTEWRKPDQIIQPWMFGHDASKQTCLWLKNLPKLEHGEIIRPKNYLLVSYKGEGTVSRNGYNFRPIPSFNDDLDGWSYPKKPLWANQTPSGQNKLGPSEDRWAKRSKTYEGIAKAMAEQWGNL